MVSVDINPRLSKLPTAVVTNARDRDDVGLFIHAWRTACVLNRHAAIDPS